MRASNRREGEATKSTTSKGGSRAMRDKALLITALALIGAGLLGALVLEAIAPLARGGIGVVTGRSPSLGGAGATAARGQRIYQSGRDANGRTIPRTTIPFSEGALMMGGGGCASCHGANGRGSTVSMMAGYIEAPDITYKSLANEGYTDAKIYRAIRYGISRERQAVRSGNAALADDQRRGARGGLVLEGVERPMMRGYDYGFGNMMGGGWFWGLLAMLMWLAVIVGVVLLVVWAIRQLSRGAHGHDVPGRGYYAENTGPGGPPPGGSGQDRACEIARERYARGEITREQYADICHGLGVPGPPPRQGDLGPTGPYAQPQVYQQPPQQPQWQPPTQQPPPPPAEQPGSSTSPPEPPR